MQNELINNYGGAFEENLLLEIQQYGRIKKVQPGDFLIDFGQTISAMPLLFSGAIKVLREDENGDELLLYFLEKGDTCAMTFSCCMGQSKSEIRAVAETEAELLMIPIAQMELWMQKYKSWRAFVLNSYHSRMTELLETVDSLAFMKMDERLLKYLFDKSKVNKNSVVRSTHHEIAQDLNSSRVVISRLLKKLENKGKIAQQRNYIKLLDI